MTTKNTKQADACNCWVRHATSPQHRAQVTHDLNYFRSIGDMMGIMMAMAQLSQCPSANS